MKKRQTVNKAISESSFVDWILFGDLIATHGPNLSESIKLIHYWQTQIKTQATEHGRGQYHVNIPEDDFRKLGEVFARGVLELDAELFERFARSVRQYKTTGEPADRLRLKIHQICKGHAGEAWTINEWAERLDYKGRLDDLRALLKGMRLAVGKKKVGRPKKARE